MLIFQGKSVYGGVSIGRIKILRKNNFVIPCYNPDNPEKEYKRFSNAREIAKKQLRQLQENAKEKVGNESAAIFEIHEMMLEDSDFIESIEDIICRRGYNAEYAVSVCCESFATMFSSMNDNYMAERAADVKDICERLINILRGITNEKLNEHDSLIMVAEDFSPSETLQLDTNKISAFVTAKGSLNSHTAILARMMNIPALIGIDLYTDSFFDGKIAVVDGYSGKIYVEPDADFLEMMQEKARKDTEKSLRLQEYKGKETKTSDGKKIKLYANISNLKDLQAVHDNDAEGIGLFRSEFIFLEKNTYPSEEEQFAIYKTALESMNGKKVIIRTLDIGADKKVDYFNLKKEENPAMGLRAIRLCLKEEGIFKTQLKALMRASVYGNLSIMYPMITSVNEIKRIKAIVQSVDEELNNASVPHSVPEQGIMIETPAAALISDLLAKEVSFFSVGTNDLSQYTMAIDRQNEEIEEFFDAHHEAILRMIDITVKNAHREKIWVGICGELAADLKLTEKLIKIGVDELSVSPSSLLLLRKTISEIKIK